MNLEALIKFVKKQMPEKRWQHTVGVVNSAKKLAKQYGADVDKAELAAILHDLAKYWPIEKQKQVITRDGHALEILEYEPVLWHAEVGAIIARQELGVTDEDVLNAVRYHTSGRVNMTKLEKVICLADYIEPGRAFPGVDDIREQATVSLERGLLTALNQTIGFLISKHQPIYPLTLLTRNDLLLQIDF